MEQTYDIQSLRGLNDYGTPLLSNSYTRSLNGVVNRNNRLIGGLGMNKLRSISAASGTTPILRLMPFYDTDLTTVLYRMTPTKVYQLNTGTDVWDDKTGTALNGLSTTIPQYTVHKDTLVFVNEGLDRPRYLLGSGNSTPLASSTAPYAKCVWGSWGFLFLGNVSDNGSDFTPREVRYSDDFSQNWDLCNGNILVFNETNGAVLSGWPIGTRNVVFKSDALMWLEFTGGRSPFNQDRVDCPAGLLAIKSVALVEGIGLVFLGTDYRLRFTDGFVSKPVPPYVQRKLDEVLYRPRARWAVGANYPDIDTYSLFFQTSSSDSWNRGRIMFNFRTGEFNYKTYTAHEFTDVATFRYNATDPTHLIASTTDKVYELDTEQETDDGTTINRYYDVDWTDLEQQGEKYLKGVTLEAVRNAKGRVGISVASNYNPDFIYEKFYDLRGLKSSDEYVRVHYRIDPGLKGYRFKVRIRLFHDDGTVVEVVPPLKIHWEPESPFSTQDHSRSPSPERN